MNYSREKALREVQKPGRYIGLEPNAVYKNKDDVDLRFAFCFPDTYEVGMSHLGMKILYSLLNAQQNIWCERVFAPWFDMKQAMEKHDVPLYALESKDGLDKFDVVGFTLQFELSYTTILYMLDLAGIPLKSSARKETFPLIVAGGPCACNPEPIAEFVDMFMLGEGEEVILELSNLIIKAKKEGYTKRKLLIEASKIKGVYVPSLYKVEYNEDGTVCSITSKNKAPLPVQKRIIGDINTTFFPKEFVVPMIEVIQDRVTTEVLRGCIRGCRFCQAGYIYRPFRPKDYDVIDRQAKTLCENTGYDEISLTSLSTSDHPEINEMLDSLLDWTVERKINLSLPSLRIDTLTDELIEKTTKVRKSGLTIAPEAGTQRLRDAINKNLTEQEILDGCKTAFMSGFCTVKLYFMIGLPTETEQDIIGIATLAQKIVDLFYSLSERPKGKSVSVNISLACFVPKPFTPFEFFKQNSAQEFEQKQRLIKEHAKSRKISVKWHDAKTSIIEAVLARGDRRLGKVLLNVYKDGGIFESWDEGFSYERWEKALKKAKLDKDFYASREREFDETMPWDIFDYGVDKKYLKSEYKKAKVAKATNSCHAGCSACGIEKISGRKCFAYD